jgi:hypothetical protein
VLLGMRMVLEVIEQLGVAVVPTEFGTTKLGTHSVATILWESYGLYHIYNEKLEDKLFKREGYCHDLSRMANVMDSIDLVNAKEVLVLGLNTRSHTSGPFRAEDIKAQYRTILEVNGEYIKESNGEEVKGLLQATWSS